MQLFTRKQFVEAVTNKDLPKEYALVKHCTLAVKEPEGAPASTLDFVISTGDVDADKDTLSPAGWNLQRYLKNPVVLFGHDHRSPPIGKAIKVWADSRALYATDKFMTEDEVGDAARFAQSIYRMVKAGYLNATSVGFMPEKWGFDETRGGFDFESQELLEHSVVPVPSNPNALQLARSAGIDLGPLKNYVMMLLDEKSGLFLRSEVEGMWQQMKTHASVQVPAEQQERSEPEQAEQTPEPEQPKDAEVLAKLVDGMAKMTDVMSSVGTKLEILLSKDVAGEREGKSQEPEQPQQREASTEDYEAYKQALKEKCRMQITGKLPD